MAVTSQLRATAAFGELWIESWREAGLLKPSAVKPVIATLEHGLVMRKLSSLAAPDRKALLAVIERIIG